jgi:hypothetical protein
MLVSGITQMNVRWKDRMMSAAGITGLKVAQLHRTALVANITQVNVGRKDRMM